MFVVASRVDWKLAHLVGTNAYVMMHRLWSKSQAKAFSDKGEKHHNTWMEGFKQLIFQSVFDI